jgi:hypothetical protein
VAAAEADKVPQAPAEVQSQHEAREHEACQQDASKARSKADAKLQALEAAGRGPSANWAWTQMEAAHRAHKMRFNDETAAEMRRQNEAAARRQRDAMKLYARKSKENAAKMT